MQARWVLVYAVDPASVPRVARLLRSELDIVVSSEADTGEATVVAMEVLASPAVIERVTTLVRSVDPEATRIHDVVVDLVKAVPGLCDVYLDFEVDDVPEPCPHCVSWRPERVLDADGRRVLREWHRRSCPVYVMWS